MQNGMTKAETDRSRRQLLAIVLSHHHEITALRREVAVLESRLDATAKPCPVCRLVKWITRGKTP